MKSPSTESFLGSGNTLYDTITVDACHYYTFIQTHRVFNTKGQPQV